MSPSHVTSLALSLALREAGYPQENALFYWFNKDLPFIHYEDFFLTSAGLMLEPIAAAVLASELLDALPRQVHGKYLNITKAEDNGYYVTYGEGDYGGEHKPILANALAKLWLHIHSQKII